MNWFDRIFRRSNLYDELAEEMREHLEERTEQFQSDGMSREEADQAARRSFGNPTLLEERSREVWQWPTLESIWADTQYALRQLARSPGFALTAILTLTLGIGANTAVFGVLNSVLLRPLPFTQPDRLVRILAVKNGNPIGPSPPDARDFSFSNHTFEHLAVYDTWRKNVVTSKAGDTPEQHVVGLTSADFFAVLDIRPVLGRLFTAQEGEPGRNHVALITESFWQTHYGRSPDVLGQKLIINDVAYSIVGVLPDAIPDWFHGVPLQVFEPFLPDPAIWQETSRGSRDYSSIGRLRAGVTLQQAQADLATIAANLAAVHPVDHGFGVVVQPLAGYHVGQLRSSLLLLVGAVTLILLIACSNLAALLLARNTARRREFALRAALGASRLTLIRQILVETLLLSFLGGFFGVMLAWFCEVVLRREHPASIPQLAALVLDWRVLLFAGIAAIATSLLFGLAPALMNTRISLIEALKDGGRSSGAPARQSFRKTLVVAQLALSLLLLVAAGLFIQSIFRLQNQKLGFRVDHLLKAHFYLPPAQYSSPEAITRFCQNFRGRLLALPGVRDASVTIIYPPNARLAMHFSIEGRPVSRLDDLPAANFGVVDTHYLKTAGIPLIAGRDFSESDSGTTPIVAIVNQAFVHRFFSGENPIGRGIEIGTPASLQIPDPWMGNQHPDATIIGIMGDTKSEGLALPVVPQFITLFRQMPVLNFGFKDVLVRSYIAPDTMIGEIAQQLHKLDPRLPLSEAQTMTAYIEDLTSDRRFTTTVLTLFAALGVILAIVGVYGVISYLVVQRTQEIGIRLALGAPRSNVLWLIARQGLSLALAGVGLGVAGSLVTGRGLSSLLYDISPLDLFTLLATSVALIAVVLLASIFPGRRATQIDPMQALRSE
jgi:predicted permease